MTLFQSEVKCENDFGLHENETACRTHFHMKSFALRLVLKQRHKRTRKWPIVNCVCLGDFLPLRTLCDAYHKEFESH